MGALVQFEELSSDLFALKGETLEISWALPSKERKKKRNTTKRRFSKKGEMTPPQQPAMMGSTLPPSPSQCQVQGAESHGQLQGVGAVQAVVQPPGVGGGRAGGHIQVTEGWAVVTRTQQQTVGPSGPGEFRLYLYQVVVGITSKFTCTNKIYLL